MSKLNRNKLKKMILQEFKMMGMADMMPMGKIGAFSQDHDDMMHDMPMDNDMDALLPVHSSDATPMMGGGMMNSPKSCVSREDCCAAVMCMIECCSCPITKAALMECCEDIMAGDYD